MALIKESVDVPFVGGLDLKSDDVFTMPNKVTKLENGRFVEKNTLGTRGGFNPLLTGTAYSGSSPSAPYRISRRETELFIESATGVHAADVTGNKWKRVSGAINRASAELSAVTHPITDVLESDMAGESLSGIQVIVWTDQSSGGGFVPLAYIQVRRGTQILLQQALTSTESCCPRVVHSAADFKFYIYWIENVSGTGTIKSCTLLETLPTTLSATNTVETTYMLASTSGATTGIPMIGFMDVVVNTATTGSNIFLCHRSVTGGSVGGVRHLRISISDGYTISSSSATPVATWASGTAVEGISVCVAPEIGGPGGTANYSCWIRTATSTDGVIQLTTADFSFTFAVGATGGAPTGRITAITDPANDDFTWCAWDEGVAGSTTSRVVLGRAQIDGSGGFTVGPTTMVRSLGLATGFFSVNGTTSLYLGLNLFSTIQPTFYAVEAVTSAAVVTSAHDVCVHMSCLAAPLKNRWQSRGVPRPMAGGSVIPVFRGSQDVISLGTTVPVNNVADTNRTPIGLDLLMLVFGANAGLNFVEVDKSTVLAGADPQFFDGATLAELGFEYYPETPLATAGGVGTLPAGTYGVTCLYEWTDRWGLVHQSAPAVPTSVVVALNQRITVTVPTLRLTKKSGVRIVVYRTIANGSVYYRVQGDVLYSNSTLNVTTADTIALASESLADLTVQTGELLPTTGGVIPAEMFPSCKFVTLHQSRLFFSGLLEQRMQYTEERQGTFFPWTNAGVYYLDVAGEAGRCTATASMDDKLIVFQEGQIGALFGRGPNRLGVDNSFSNVVTVISNYGHDWVCSFCIVKDGEGIWFRDRRGLRHLNRGLQISVEQNGRPLGEEVDSKVGPAPASGAPFPKSAVYHDEQDQVRFSMGFPGTGILVYDGVNKQWSEYKSAAGAAGNFYDAIMLPRGGGLISTEGAAYVYLNSAGQTYYESMNTLSDLEVGGAATAVVLRLTTAWLKLSTIQGFQRIYKVLVVGELSALGGAFHESNGVTLQITPEVDYSVNAPTIASPTFSDWSEFTTRFQVAHKPTVQKCEAMRFTIAYSSKYGGAKFSSLALEIGKKAGTMKTRSAQRF
jgi:hypothetical protein